MHALESSLHRTEADSGEASAGPGDERPGEHQRGHRSTASTPRSLILVVDDEPGILDAYRSYLSPPRPTRTIRSSRRAARPSSGGSQASYELLCASTGEDAIAQVRELYQRGERLQAGFFDMKMPGGIDGLETIRRLLAIDPELLCVVVTAYEDQPLAELRATFGPDRADHWDYLNKPFTANEIQQKARNIVASWWRRRREEAQARALSEANTQLEAHVAARTSQLAVTNQQLFAKQRELEAALAELHATNERLRSEMRERERLETERRIAHKLEAVGQLAAGIAHEINTPTHYIGHNTHFLAEAFEDLLGAAQTLATVTGGCEHCSREVGDERAAQLADDLAYLAEEVPGALDAMRDGVAHISKIVGAMRELARPDPVEKELGDVNRAVESALAVSHPEYRYVARVEAELGELPPVRCHIGELNQVLLNLLVNAAHAIADSERAGEELGLIGVRTRRVGDFVEVTVSDNGCGVAADIADKIFDPFFTTKEVGRGTGQGLAIARTIVVEKHGGTLTCDSEPGQGARFVIRLPIG